jgi:hypothetical protein
MKSASVSRVDETGAAQSAQAAAPTTAGQPQTTTAQSARPAPTTAAPTTAGEPAPAPTTAAPTTADVSRPQTTTSSDARLKNSSGNTAAPVGTSGQQRARTELPRTASNMALFQLFSLAALAGAFGIRRLRTRFAAE